MTNEELVLLIQTGTDKKECLEKLYLQNKGFIAQIAKRYSGYAELEDLMHEGFVGLCTACDSWDADRGSSFLTYAYYYIRQSMSRYSKAQNVVRINEHQLEQIVKFEKLVNNYILMTSKKPSDRYLMLYLGMNKQQLNQLKKDAEMLKIRSLDEPVNAEDDSFSLGDSVCDPDDLIEGIDNSIQNEQLAQTLWGIVDRLDADQGTIIREKYQNNTCAQVLADKMGKTLGEVRNIEARAFRELRKHHNRKKLQPFFNSDNEYYSAGLRGSSLHSFNLTWTSAQERAVIQAELGISE